MNADDALVALIKSDHLSRQDIEGRVFPSVAPQFVDENGADITTPRPYVLVHDQGGEDDGFLEGPSGKPKGKWSIEIYGDDPDSIRMAAGWIRHKLNGFDGYSLDILFEAMTVTLPEADTVPNDSSPDQTGVYFVRRMEVEAFYSEVLDPQQYSANL